MYAQPTMQKCLACGADWWDCHLCPKANARVPLMPGPVLDSVALTGRLPAAHETCKHHGRAALNVWACPTCLVELRTANEEARKSVAELRDLAGRAQAQLAQWAAWYSEADQTARGQLPPPPTADVELAQDIERAMSEVNELNEGE